MKTIYTIVLLVIAILLSLSACSERTFYNSSQASAGSTNESSDVTVEAPLGEASSSSSTGRKDDDAPIAEDDAPIAELEDQQLDPDQEKFYSDIYFMANSCYLTGMFYTVWESAMEIDVYRLLQSYWFTELREAKSDTTVDAEDVEAFIQRHFDVSSDYLRTSEYYVASNNTYLFPPVEGLGSGGGVYIERVVSNKEIMQIYYEDGNAMKYCLTVNVAGSDYKYVSNLMVDSSFDANSSISENPEDGHTSESEVSTNLDQQVLKDYVVLFAQMFPHEFESAYEFDDVAVGWFSFWRIIEDNQLQIQNDGTCFISKEDLLDYVNKHFGISDYQYPSDQPPEYNVEDDGYHFYPIGEASRYVVEFISSTIEDGIAAYDVLLTLTPMSSSDPAEEQPKKIRYEFKVQAGNGTDQLQALKATLI